MQSVFITKSDTKDSALPMPTSIVLLVFTFAPLLTSATVLQLSTFLLQLSSMFCSLPLTTVAVLSLSALIPLLSLTIAMSLSTVLPPPYSTIVFLLLSTGLLLPLSIFVPLPHAPFSVFFFPVPPMGLLLPGAAAISALSSLSKRIFFAGLASPLSFHCLGIFRLGRAFSCSSFTLRNLGLPTDVKFGTRTTSPTSLD